jgi:hypothetical protein
MRMITSTLLSKDYYYRQYIYLRENQVLTDDYFFNVNYRDVYTFYDCVRKMTQKMLFESNEDEMLYSSLHLMDSS